MNISAGNYIVVVEEPRELGAAWVVRVCKRMLFFNKVVSSDWFLQKEQAENFAQEIAERLKNGTTVDQIRSRKPGWTLFAQNT